MFILKALLGVATGGGTFLLSLLGTVAPGLATSIGDIFLKAKQTQAAREGKQDEQGTVIAGGWLSAVTESNRTRAAARKDEGAWGPMGIVTFVVGLAFGYHVWFIVLDSSPFYLWFDVVWGFLPYPAWVPHKVGSWGVAALPGRFHEVELAVLQALFYVAPPATAAVLVAKAFRR